MELDVELPTKVMPFVITTCSLNVQDQTCRTSLVLAELIADEIVVMYQGGVVEQGTKEEILTPPHAPYTELLLSSVPEMDPDWLDDLVDRRERGEAPTAKSIASRRR